MYLPDTNIEVCLMKNEMWNRLNRIRISGFKSICEMELELKNLTVLIGANGAGKSNFVSFFRLLNYMTSNSLPSYIAEKGGANSLLHFGIKTTTSLGCTLYFETQAGKNVYNMNMAKGAGDTLFFTNEEVAFSRSGSVNDAPLISLGGGHTDTKMNLKDLNPLSKIGTTAKTIRNIMNQWRFYQFHDTSDTARIKQQTLLNDCYYLRADAGNIAAFLYMLKHKYLEYYDRIVTTIRQIAPFFYDFVLEPTYDKKSILLQWKDINSDMVFNADQLSDGTIRTIALVTLLLQPHLPSLVCVDEPELGLHPYAIGVLSSLLKKASKTSQIIVSTQSVPLINQMDIEDLVVVDKIAGKSTFKRLILQDFEQWLNDYSLGELWESNLIGGRPSR
ncbi:MAG: DUF2813 domain-containing protein [Ruminiclostridium sp.]|nr:DUF2813 domain-containing protein [Ruminiclostridium sp.]